MNPYPLVFEPMLLGKVWGGDRLARFGKEVPPGARVGESWEVADLAETAASGAGGGARRSVIANGPLRGRTLTDALREWGAGLLGRAAPAAGGGFPLLVKFLDARENLSVQVHPSPAYAAANPCAHLKTECWYILDAAPGSVIYKGIQPGVTREAFARHASEGTVERDLVAVPAVAGECHALPSGTCHALGAGVLVAEVQTPSDTTFRVHDWGRAGRELHVAQSLECIEFGPAPPAVRLRDDEGSALRTEFFTLARVSSANEDERPVSGEGACCVVMAVGGLGSLYHEDGDFAPLDVAAGTTVLVPAACAAGAILRGPESGRLETLVARLPIR